MDVDIYKCCRFCHWFGGGGCNHENTFRDTDRDSLVDMICLTTEAGHIHDAIKEVMDADAITEIVRSELLKTRLSLKAVNKIIDAIAEQIHEKLLVNWIPDITDAVQDKYIDGTDDLTQCNTTVVDEHTFYCRYYE